MTVPQRPQMVFNALNMFTATHHDQGIWACGVPNPCHRV